MELFGANGCLVWSGKAEAPCIVDIKKPFKHGIYFSRVLRNGVTVKVNPIFF